MNYVLKSSFKNKKNSILLKTLSIFTVFLLILYFIFPNFLPTLFAMIAHPFWEIQNSSTNIEPDLPINAQNMIFNEIQKENFQLKEILGRVKERKVVIAQILKKPPFSAYDSFIIDINENSGIVIGDKVYVLGDILIGEIVDITGPTSKVKLYSSYGEKNEVFVGEDNIQVLAVGRGGGSFEAVLPKGVDVKEGDHITIHNEVNPLFASVGKIIADPTQVFSTIFFSYPINIYEQKWVVVEKNH